MLCPGQGRSRIVYPRSCGWRLAQKGTVFLRHYALIADIPARVKATSLLYNWRTDVNKQVKEHIKRAINSNGVTKRIWSGAGRPALLQYRKIRSRLAHRAELRRWDAGLASLSESGVLPEQAQRSPRLIVSLTSFPKRMHEVVYTVYSLLTQTMKPDIVCLWLSVEEFPHREAELPS